MQLLALQSAPVRTVEDPEARWRQLTAQQAEELIYLSPGAGRMDYHKFVDALFGPPSDGARAQQQGTGAVLD